MIQISVDTRRAVVNNKELLTVGSAGIQVQFALSEDWAGLSKLAVFRVGDDGTKVDVVLSESLTCVVPPEVLTEEDEVLFIGIYGTNGQGTVIIPTVWASAGVVRPGTEPNTPASAEPTPEIWAQILSVANDAEQTATEAMSAVEAGLQDLSVMEGNVETAEAQRVIAEQGRVTAEQQRAAAENIRAAAEGDRAMSESARVDAEQDRVIAETGRVAAENARVTAEASRVTAEQGRVAAEENRESHYAEYVEAAGDYANAASASATSAAGSATDAASSASSASTSAGQAASSASSASSSASQASNSALSASTSATTASNAATTATTQAGIATTKAGEAASSATAASASATAAGNAQTAAETAQAAAEDAAELLQPAATSADVGKALIVKTVSGGVATSYEYGNAGGASDAGEVTYDETATYPSGTVGAVLSNQKNAIDQLDASLAPVESTSTASRPYVVGDLLMYQNRLYKVSSQIAADGTLIVGTNIVATTVEDEIASGGGGGEAASGYVIGVEAINKILVPDFTVTATGRDIKKVKNKISIKRTGSNSNSQVVSLSGDSVRSSQTLFSGYTPNIGNLVPISKLNTLKGICFNKPDTSPNSMIVRLQLYKVVDETITNGNYSNIELDSMRDKITVATLPTAGDSTHFEVVLVTRNTSGLPEDNYADIILEFKESA